MSAEVKVKLSYEEKVLNALSRVEHKRSDSCIERDKKDFDAIREVLAPLYDEAEQLRIQLAGCSVAAFGYAKGDLQVKPGDYGHSVAYDDVKRLYDDYASASKKLGAIRNAWFTRRVSSRSCSHCRYEDGKFLGHCGLCAALIEAFPDLLQQELFDKDNLR